MGYCSAIAIFTHSLAICPAISIFILVFLFKHGRSTLFMILALRHSNYGGQDILHELCQLVVWTLHVQYLGSICELAVDGWEKLFGTNSASFHHKWATERNFNGTNMHNMSLETKNQRIPILDCNVWTGKGFSECLPLG